MTDFITDYSKYITDKYPTNKDWATLCSLTVLSTVIGNKTKLYTRLGDLSLNLYSLNIGESRTSYKSTPLKYVVIPTLISAGEQSDDENKYILPSRWSLEGMIEYLNEITSEGCIIRDEFSGLFKGIKNKQYLAETLELLSEMYDGQIQIRYTKSSKLEKISNCLVNLLAATTPFIFDIMEKEFFIQGTGNRILFVRSNPLRKKVLARKKDQFLPTNSERIAMLPAIQNFASRLINISKNVPTHIQCTFGDANKLLNQLGRKYTNKAFTLQKKNNTDINANYYADIDIQAAKLAALHCISRKEFDLSNEQFNNNIPFEKIDVQWAIIMIEKFVDHYDNIMEEWSKHAESKKVVTSKNEFMYIETIIRGNDGKISLGDLVTKTSMKSDQLEPILKSLIQSGIIKEGKEDTGKRGPKPTYYYLLNLK